MRGDLVELAISRKDALVAAYAKAAHTTGDIPDNTLLNRNEEAPSLSYPSNEAVSFETAIKIILAAAEDFASQGYCQMLFEMTEGGPKKKNAELVAPAEMTIYTNEIITGGALAAETADIFTAAGYRVGFPFFEHRNEKTGRRRYIVCYRLEWFSIEEAESIARAVTSEGGYEAFCAGVPIEDIDA